MRIRVLVVLALLLCAACSTTQKKARELERVAKDWCLTIRASQVLPAYPLTEDLQVGDLYIVSTPIEEESRLLEQKGFLPLDNLVARIDPTGYEAFYRGAYGVSGDGDVPHQWQFPNPPRTTAPTTNWAMAPGAAFPTYTFEIKQGAGATLALPIHSVPVGLSLLSTANAYGSVNINGASTYAVPITILSPQVDDWAKNNRPFLRLFAPRVDKGRFGKQRINRNFVRTVYRVYVASGVDVSLTDDSSRGGRVDAGASKAIALYDAGDSNGAMNAANNMQQMLKALNQNVAASIPSANVTVTSVSSRAVAMSETFPRPLVIGYLAFDRSIEEGGLLGPPMPTYARMYGRAAQFNPDQSSERINNWLQADPQNMQTLQTWLTANGHDPKNVAAYVWGQDYAMLRRAITTQFGIE